MIVVSASGLAYYYSWGFGLIIASVVLDILFLILFCVFRSSGKFTVNDDVEIEVDRS